MCSQVARDSIIVLDGDRLNAAVRPSYLICHLNVTGVDIDNEGILVLGTTNISWVLDIAICRHFEKRIYIDQPGNHTHLIMIKLHLGYTHHEPNEDDLKVLALKTERFEIPCPKMVT